MAIGAAGLALGGYLFGVMELYPLAAAAGTALVAALALVTVSRARVDVSRSVSPSLIPEGDEARIELTIGNRGRWATSPMEVADGFGDGTRWARFAVASLPSGQTRRASYRLPVPGRGVHNLGPLLLQVSDPLGLARRVVSAAPHTALTVHPRFELVAVHGASPHRHADRVDARPQMGTGGGEFYRLRPYVPGDDLRQVHWLSTARIDDLVIRQTESLRRGRLTVAVDLRAQVHAGSSLGPCLSAAASVSMSALSAGLDVRLVTTAGSDTGHGQGSDTRTAILETLAAAEVHRDGRAAPFGLIDRSEPAVVITTDRTTGSDLGLLVGVGGGRGAAVVTFATPGGPGPTANWGVHVPLGGSFVEAWPRREAAWS